MEHVSPAVALRKYKKSKPSYTLKRVIRPLKFYIKSRTVAKTFSNYFSVTSSLSEEDKQAMYGLRHKVYCEELGFQFASRDNQESDSYDEHSKFCAVKHLSSDDIVGSVRLVESRHQSQRLPIEDTCNSFYEDCSHLPEHFERHQIAEISRLVVAPDYRKKTIKRKQHSKNIANVSNFDDIEAREFEDKHELQNFKYIAVSLYLGAMVMAQQTNRPHIFIITTPNLAQSLSCFGIQLKRIGYAFEYQGLRAPYYIDVELTAKCIHGGFRRLLKVVEASMLDDA